MFREYYSFFVWLGVYGGRFGWKIRLKLVCEGFCREMRFRNGSDDKILGKIV